MSGQVIVITGASSGIGLATARLAAEHGARVVLASSNAEALDLATRQIRSSGGDAVAFVCDVADEAAVDRLGDFAIERFGRVDAWINNASVSIFGQLTRIPLAAKRKLFDVNFWGAVHGCATAVRLLRDSGGAIVHVGNVLDEASIPLHGVDAASRHAVRGYVETLRQELAEEGLPIRISWARPVPEEILKSASSESPRAPAWAVPAALGAAASLAALAVMAFARRRAVPPIVPGFEDEQEGRTEVA